MSLYSFGHPRKHPGSEDLEAVKCHLPETLRVLSHLMSQEAQNVSQNETKTSNKYLNSASSVVNKTSQSLILS